MKVIDLLNKIANGEEVPEKIKVHDTEYHKCILKTGIDYKIYSDDFYYLSNDICKAGFSLNDEVEIIEEKKIPEKLETWYSVLVKQSDEDNVEYANYNFSTMYEKINEIIDYLESEVN